MSKESDLWWVPDETEVWTLATQSGAQQPNGCINFLIQKNQKIVAYQRERCLPAHNVINAPEDLVFLHDVNQATILSCTRTRFVNHKIYTNMGQVLMSVNPFEKINGLYGPKVIEEFKNPDSKNICAHVYSIPSRAYSNMCRTGGNQSILISGESGAGKTEATKQCLSFLTVAANAQQQNSKNVHGTESSVDISEIANRIIAASPILEAFGNAQTIRNPNSSRFGKWMVLNFDRHNVINSSTVVSYLLEKSRVTQRDPKERNYHIFYQILRGAQPDQLHKWGLSPETFTYRYLVQEPGVEAPDLHDSAVFLETSNALVKMGFTAQEALDTFKLVGAVLLLGNIVFMPTHDGEGSDVRDVDVVASVATLLSVSPSILGYSLCNRSIESGKARKSMISIQLNVQKANETRDSLAKALYDKLFQEIILTINLNSKNNNNQVADRCIGLLDIFGFEIFVENSFEQLCINYCNEMLQNQFNYVIFTAEKSLYDREGIHCNTIEFKDNADAIRDIEAVFKALDEEGRIPRGTSKTWFDKLKRGTKSQTVVFPNRKVGDVFVVKHYAGDVDYSAAGFLEKNVEALNNDLVGAMISSTDPVVCRIFTPVTTAEPPVAASVTSKGGATTSAASSKDAAADKPGARKSSNTSSLANKTISWRFTNQLHQLMTMLKLTESHFIRCVKSNEACQAGVFDSNLVHKQLIYSGVFEVVKIQQSGLPCRLPHREFVDRYRCLASSKVRYGLHSPSELIRSLVSVNKLDLPLAQMGVSLTFFKGSEQRTLETKRDELFLRSSIRLQAWVQMLNRSRLYQKLIHAYREFWDHDSVLDLQAAQDCFEFISGYCDLFRQLTRRSALGHVIAQLSDQLVLIEKRVVVIRDAEVQYALETEAGVISLDEIISRAIDLDMTHHTIIAECKTKVQKYYRALEFAAHVSSTQQLTNLSLQHISEGISNLQLFKDIIPSALEVVDRAVEHKRVVDHEIEHILTPMQHAFVLSSVKFDRVSGNLLDIHPESAQVPSLRSLVDRYADTEFNCQDVQLLYIDCVNFLQLKEDFVPADEATGALDFIARCQSSCATMTEQLEQFRQWADIQMSAAGLRMLLETGWIPKTDLGSEHEVQVEHIEKMVDKLRSLENPSDLVVGVIRAGTWMIMLRKAFLDKAWDQLEQIVLDADEDGTSFGTFDEYPSCVDELNNAQWQVIYHGLMADVVYVTGEPVFATISLDADNWADLVKELGENMVLTETVQSFAQDSSSPKLLKLVPMLENLLQLRSLMYKRDIALCKTIHNGFLTMHEANIAEHKLSDALTAELTACGLLIQKVEYEDALDAAMNTHSLLAKPYSYAGTTDQPSYASLCDLSVSIQQLSRALKCLDDLSSSYNLSLFDKIQLGRVLLRGRELLMRSEEDSSVDWEASHKEYHHSVFEVTRDLDGVVSAEVTTSEFAVIQEELVRRVLLAHLRGILRHTCVHGSVDVDVHVKEEELVDLFVKFNDCTRLLTSHITTIPNNVKALATFTNVLLKVRKCVLEHAWEGGLKPLMSRCTSMDSGAGLAVTGVKAELEKVGAEVRAKEAYHALKRELETISLVAPSSSGGKENTALVDMTTLRSAIVAVRPNQGKHSKKLLNLAELVVSVLESLLSGRSNLIDQDKISDIAAQYSAFHLNALAMERVFKFIKVHNFLKVLCDTMKKFHTAERLLAGVNELRASLKAIPPKFIPWLKAAYVFCELLRSFESRDWVKIVEATKRLEECITVLVDVKITTVGEGLHEAEFVSILTEKKVAGYKTALTIKNEQEQLRSEEEICGLSPEEALKLQLRKMDEGNPQGIAELRSAGYDDKAILHFKPQARFLWAHDFDLVLLRKANYPASQLRGAGYKVADLYFAGYSVEKLRDAGCDVPELRIAGVTFDQLRLAGFEERDILSGEMPVNFLKNAEYDASKLIKLGLTTKDLIAAGLSARELRAAGFSAAELKNSILGDPRRLFDAGYDMPELKAAYDISELRLNGFTFSLLKQSGYTDKSLFDVGFEFELERDALEDLFAATSGPQWVNSANWTTDKPMAEWFGVQTELDDLDRDRVVGLTLANNGLSGTLPEKLWVLSRIRSLQLSDNRLFGSVPPLLAKRLQGNKAQVNVSGNPGLQPFAIAPSRSSTPNRSRTNSQAAEGLVSQPASPRSTQDAAKASTESSNESKSAVEVREGLEEVEREALMDLFHATRGAAWTQRHHWGSHRSIAEWFGVTVNKAGKVVKLVLPLNNLNGPIPDTICHLRSLRELDLRYNKLSGHIPNTIGSLEHLAKLHLQSNKLSCAIPESISSLSRLSVLDLRSNQLTDNIPQCFLRLTKLVYFGLRSNKLNSASVHAVPQLLPWCKVVM